MSLTGIVLAFQTDILSFLDRDVRHVAPPPGASRLGLDALMAEAQAARPDFEGRGIRIPSRPDEAYSWFGRGEEDLYLDPYTGELSAPRSTEAHEALHFVEDLHRFLGLEGDAQPIGKLIHGVANFALIFLCLSGLLLWFPRRWATKKLRRFFFLVKTKSPQARDFNLHSVFGIWSLLALLVIAASALPISFGWAHALIFEAAGEEAPVDRNFRMMMVPPRPVAPPTQGEAPLALDEVHRRVAEAYPGYEEIQLSFDRAEADAPRPLDIRVIMPALFSTRGLVMVQMDPYRGTFLSSLSFGDRSPALRARIWTRFLHTGEAFGFAGRLAAALASAAALLLAVTGGLMSYRRLGRWRSRA